MNVSDSILLAFYTAGIVPATTDASGATSGTTHIVIFRSTLGYTTQGNPGPLTEMGIVTAATGAITWAGEIYERGNEEYDVQQFETYDYDWRDSAVDGRRAVAAGYASLGHWTPVYAPYFQFRGSIHHLEMHTRALSDVETADVINSLIPT